MPETTATSLIDSHRTCPAEWHVGERTIPFTRENFYHRPNGTVDYWCRQCVREYNRRRRAERASRPSVDRRKFGVEIEFIGDAYAVAQAMTDIGLPTEYEGYNHRVRRGWKIVSDASVSRGAELVSPPLSGENGFEQLTKACEALRTAGATVNRSCGLHVHHEVSDLNIVAFRRLFRGWHHSQAATDQLVAASRRGSDWALPLREREVMAVEALEDCDEYSVGRVYTDRYRSLNIRCFPRYGTVEVRQHQGTINAKKIAAWVRFGQAMIRRAMSTDEQPVITTAHRLLDLLARHGMDADTVAYLKARAESFGAVAPATSVAG